MIVLAATAFASESALHTWKNLVPRARRWQLVIAKFAVILLLMFLSFNGMAILTGVVHILIMAGAGSPITPDPATADWGGFVLAYGQGALLAMVAVLFSICFAVIGALVARSVQVGIVAGVAAILLEQSLVLVFIILSNLLQMPRLVALHQLTPSYNLQNLTAWFQTGSGVTFFAEWPGLTSGLMPNSPALSALILTIWLVGMVTLSVWLMIRRDVG